MIADEQVLHIGTLTKSDAAIDQMPNRVMSKCSLRMMK